MGQLHLTISEVGKGDLIEVEEYDWNSCDTRRKSQQLRSTVQGATITGSWVTIVLELVKPRKHNPIRQFHAPGLPTLAPLFLVWLCSPIENH